MKKSQIYQKTNNINNVIELQFSSYQLADIQDSLIALDHLFATISSFPLYNLSNIDKTIKRIAVDQFRALYSQTQCCIQKSKTPTRLITVIRAAFVFKKTREQFALKKYSYRLVLNHAAIPGFRNFLLIVLATANFASELKIITNNC